MIYKKVVYRLLTVVCQ